MNRPILPAGLDQNPVIAILRGCPLRHAVAMAGAAIRAGLTVIEVTLDSERTFEQIAAIRSAHPEAEVGVGTVRHAEEVAPAVEAGAGFVVSPIVDDDVIRAADAFGVASIPGAATPTEIERAVRKGATAVKVFPADQLGGPAYLKTIRAPLGSPPLIPTGGVTAGSIREYLKAGAVAVGVGGTLFPNMALHEGDVTTVERLAKEIVAAVK
jgi:2-dehydro-3-deoxyphosphogluconate aldolase/(4S)-4-hydroxy-2-oxoglutarate aldolase